MEEVLVAHVRVVHAAPSELADEASDEVAGRRRVAHGGSLYHNCCTGLKLHSIEWMAMDYVPRRVLDAPFRRLGRRELLDRLHAVRALAGVRGMRYFDDRGRPRTIDIALKPWVLT